MNVYLHFAAILEHSGRLKKLGLELLWNMINNLLTSHIKALVWDFPVMTSLSVYKYYYIGINLGF